VVTSGALVILDCDGVLVDTEPIAIEVRVRVLKRAGWELSADEVVERFLGRSHEYVISEVQARVGREAAKVAEDEFRRECEVVFRERLRPVVGIVEALGVLTARPGIQTCVASSGGHDKMRLTLGLTGLWSTFEDRIYSAEDVPHGKPAPDLFLHAAEQMGFAADRCVVVEDSRAGIEAGLAADMGVVGYCGGVSSRMGLALPGVVVIDRMADLPPAIESLMPL
jgi:beta-phosphoglucomutase-like phosphatase (HAD superfamily)